MKRYWLINLSCVLLSLFFLLGTVYAWREMLWTSEIDYEAELGVANGELETGNLKLENKDKEIGNWKLEMNDSSTTVSLIRMATSGIVRVNVVLPPQYLLPVPFTSQAPEKNWDEPWQDACEEAAVLMLDAYYKGYDLSPLFAKDEILKMIEWEKERGWGNSLEIERVKELAERFVSLNHIITPSPHHVKIVENPTIDDIKKFVGGGNPVLALADGKVLPNPHFRNNGPVYHALIIRGYTETEFITNDPGTQFGKGFRYKYDDLLNAVHDWNNGDVKNGRKAALVVE
ncbi:MAG: C39 family peptidase [Candidatus Magasanikbacteria bacterium]|nr:C39 family peptidase [Candidatus Magasanikbacteria bacterium]